MKDRVDLTEETLDKLEYGDLIAITVAEGGAMGDPGAIELVDKDLKLYYTHFGEIDIKKLKNKLTLLKTLELALSDIDNLEKGWAGFYMGYGNYLFVKSEFEEPIREYIEKNYGDTSMPFVVELYSHWYEGLRKIAKKNGAATEV